MLSSKDLVCLPLFNFFKKKEEQKKREKEKAGDDLKKKTIENFLTNFPVNLFNVTPTFASDRSVSILSSGNISRHQRIVIAQGNKSNS